MSSHKAEKFSERQVSGARRLGVILALCLGFRVWGYDSLRTVLVEGFRPLGNLLVIVLTQLPNWVRVALNGRGGG